MPGRDAWLASRLPHQVPPQEEVWDLWTIWGDRAVGKTRAALEEVLEWCRKGAGHTSMGPRSARVGIFVRDVRDGMAQMVYGDAGIVTLCEETVQVDSMRDRVTFPNGAVIQFFPFSDADSVRCSGITHAFVEDSDRATPPELDRIMRTIIGELKWQAGPRIIMTCHILPPWPVHKLAGGRNHLTVSATATLNTSLPETFIKALEKSRP